MKFLHTADWHVGKVLKTQSRQAEHKAVLADLVRIADEEDVDAVLIAGDLFDSAVPRPESQALVMRTLLALKENGRHVVALAGNHDDPRLLDVYRPVLGELGIHMLGQPRRPSDGGVITFTSRRGEVASVAALPFVAHRQFVRAAELLLHDTARHKQDYANGIKRMVDGLTAGFHSDTINMVMTHATLLGGRRGGGERDVQTGLDYELPNTVFPASAHYVALGHLHRAQAIEGPCPIHYSGSPIAVDFGEEANESVALIVNATPDSRAVARAVPITGGRRLTTVRGSFDAVVAAGVEAGDAFLRVILSEPARAGLGDEVRKALPGALEVQLDPAFRPASRSKRTDQPTRVGRTPQDLFSDYLVQQHIADPRLNAMFAELLDDVTGASAGGDV